jgi:hypothetical protein
MGRYFLKNPENSLHFEGLTVIAVSNPVRLQTYDLEFVMQALC